ncbi:MAG: FAD-dependent oxidoreductase [Chloroflexota bacterium]|nr:FAD-dependent oxidoreductase [Chloroflexota bacterium]
MKVVIVGAGPAGVSVAETLRQYDHDTEIVMLSSEPFAPYSPPAMAEHFINGRDVLFWKGEDFATRMGVDYKAGCSVSCVHPEQHTIDLENGGCIKYDKLVIASGGATYAPVRGLDKDGVYNFKSLIMANRLVRRVREGNARTAIIVGAGFVGVEIALLLRELGVNVTLLVRSRIMRSVLDAEVSEIVSGALRERGIDLRSHVGADVVAFIGEKHAEAVQTITGEQLYADLLIAATGLKPNVEYLKGSGIEVGWGVQVDDHHGVTLDVYAAGDVVECKNRISDIRQVHANFPNAVAQGQVVAYNLLGWNVSYDGAETMNSLKHLGIPVVVAGSAEGEELSLRLGETLRKLYLIDNRIVGFQLVGDIRSAGIYRTMMNNRLDVTQSKHRLLDPAFCMEFSGGGSSLSSMDVFS